MTPEGAQHADALKQLGFTAQLPLRVLQTPIRRDLLAQASFDSLTVHKLLEMRQDVYKRQGYGGECAPEYAVQRAALFAEGCRHADGGKSP